MYTDEMVQKLEQEHSQTNDQLLNLFLRVVAVSQEPGTRPLAAEYLSQGVARRIGVIRRSIENIFSLFPPNTKKPIDRDDLADVNINLHAFMINMVGAFDNMAWAYLHQHSLIASIPRQRVGLFSKETQKLLPASLVETLTSGDLARWHEEYLKNYRDALAHRIAPYVPPSQMTPADVEREKDLAKLELEHLKTRSADGLDAVSRERHNMGTSNPMFLHSFNEFDKSRPILLHPQLLVDGKTLVEFASAFMGNWRLPPE